MKVLKIKDIVRTISITHKFDKDKLIAINTSDVENGIMHDGTLTAIEDLKGQFKKTVQKGDILFSEIRPANRRFALVIKDDCADYVVSTKLMVLRKYNNEVDLRYFYYCLTNQPFLDMLQRKAENRIGSFPQITFDLLSEYAFPVPSLSEQEKIANIIFSLDHKIELNKQINDNLEAMAKQLYDYWFVQFDFPNEEGKPYKSSGGAMVWNEELHMNIPYSWNTCLLNDYIGSNNTGDWGFDEPAEKRNMKVGCIRGADIVKLNDLPTRYIKDSNTSKLLSVWDIVIEVSGGSPTQATGRSAFVTPGVLKRNGGNLTCSNFCHAFIMKNYKASAYFFFMWRMFYDNNNMFNYEGKTSGIKNFMTDTFLANKWLDVSTALLDLFFERIKVIYEQIDNNIEEINALTKQRDELLPLLMNGQATVNYHLSDD